MRCRRRETSRTGKSAPPYVDRSVEGSRRGEVGGEEREALRSLGKRPQVRGFGVVGDVPNSSVDSVALFEELLDHVRRDETRGTCHRHGPGHRWPGREAAGYTLVA